jgi:hypothetical protein
MSIFSVHSWLPRAQVEAPLSGCMILAGVVLKLGGYRLLRVFPALVNFFSSRFVWGFIRLIGSFSINSICILSCTDSTAHIRIPERSIICFPFQSNMNHRLSDRHEKEHPESPDN